HRLALLSRAAQELPLRDRRRRVLARRGDDALEALDALLGVVAPPGLVAPLDREVAPLEPEEPLELLGVEAPVASLDVVDGGRPVEPLLVIEIWRCRHGSLLPVMATPPALVARGGTTWIWGGTLILHLIKLTVECLHVDVHPTLYRAAW